MKGKKKLNSKKLEVKHVITQEGHIVGGDKLKKPVERKNKRRT